MNAEQYAAINARRIGHNTLLWQTPSLAIAAQALFLAIVLNRETEPILATGVAVIALVVALASLQLFHRLRWLEVRDSILMERFEASDKGRSAGFEVVSVAGRESEHILPATWLSGMPSYLIWNFALSVMILLSAGGLTIALFRLWQQLAGAVA